MRSCARCRCFAARAVAIVHTTMPAMISTTSEPSTASPRAMAASPASGCIRGVARDTDQNAHVPVRHVLVGDDADDMLSIGETPAQIAGVVLAHLLDQFGLRDVHVGELRRGPDDRLQPAAPERDQRRPGRFAQAWRRTNSFVMPLGPVRRADHPARRLRQRAHDVGQELPRLDAIVARAVCRPGSWCRPDRTSPGCRSDRSRKPTRSPGRSIAAGCPER